MNDEPPLFVDFEKEIADGTIAVSAPDIGFEKGARPSRTELVLHPNGRKPASVTIAKECDTERWFVIAKISNPNPKAQPVRFTVSIKASNIVVFETSLVLIGGTATEIEIKIPSEKGKISVVFSTQMAQFGDIIDRAWATFKDVFIGPAYIFQSYRRLPTDVISAADPCFNSLENNKPVYKTSEYKLCECEFGSDKRYNKKPMALWDSYVAHGSMSVDAASLYYLEQVIHIQKGVLWKNSAYVDETISNLPTQIIKKIFEDWFDHKNQQIAICELDTPIFIMSHYGASNYGHWLIEMLPRLYSVIDAVREGSVHVAIAKEQRKVSSICQTLLAAGIPLSQIYELPAVPILIKKAYFMSPISYHMHPGWMSPYIFSALRQLIPIPNDEKPSHPRIFVSRKDASVRQLQNEDEIFCLLQKYGFERVLSSNLNFAEQARLFYGAEIVIGVFGAAMSNVAFMQSGRTVVNIVPNNFMDHFYWNICSLKRLNYIELIGQVEKEHEEDMQPLYSFSLEKEDFEMLLRRLKLA